MKKHFYLFILIAIACTDHTPENNTKEEFNDPNWLKLEIPTGREAYAVAGSIDDTLLVTTWTKAYYTVDQGKNWTESYDFQGTVVGLLEKNDTIFSLQGHSIEQGNHYASIALYSTADHGNSWKYTPGQQLKQRIGSVTTSSGIEYFLKENRTPVSPGSSSEYVNPTDIMIRSGGDAVNTLFPYKHDILNLYLDSEERLYVIASGATYLKDKNAFECCDDSMPAIVYVSKHSMR